MTVSSPNVGDRARVLEDVDGTIADDVWAVGHSDLIDAVGSRTHVIRWNGSSWRKVPSPNRGTVDDINVLSGVVAIGADDAWAVGWYSSIDPNAAHALTFHWDGAAWHDVPNSCGRILRDVVALSSTNVWAVGGSATCHWNGSGWQRFPAAPHPNPAVSIDLQDVSASSASNIWAVGYGTTSCGEGGVCFTGVIEHRVGSSWSFSGVGETLYGVNALSPSNVYAVGLGLGPTVIHFDGSSWEHVPSPTPFIVGRLFAVDAGADGRLWAAGSRYVNGKLRTLVERAPAPNAGAVVGATGVSGATVSWFGPETGSVSANQLGRYQIGGLRTGDYTLTATSPGCTPKTKNVHVQSGTTIGVSLLINC